MRTTRGDVVSAALQVLDEKGLPGLTMRAVAERLGVQHNTVRWHAASKSRLLELASDELLAHCADEPLPDEWRERLRVLSHRCRSALLSHRDGARMVAGVFTAEPHTMRYTDTVLATLLRAGFSKRTAARAHWTVFYLTLGLAQEQQAIQDDPRALDPGEISATDYPAVTAVLPYIGSDDFDERFDFALDLLLEALGNRRTAP
ncbi:TetR/AcrR family transcriptional regulator C-terminal domain-containing protein [Streptomyces sp. NPDC088725]|uniref:TetR/AcrR family transcriptional regulator C-terminal domain-containing protein n=1 Tax=Streptomyces sp. NPDC088725 TaxID=3365873 RepID=UPI0038023992